MPDRDRPLLADAKDELGGLLAEIAEMLRLRWQLAALELRTGLTSLKHLAVALLAAGVMALTALPVLCVLAAEVLDGTVFPRWGWLLAIGVVLLVLAALVAWSARRRYRREFTGLRETLEELREDMEWLREWSRV